MHVDATDAELDATSSAATTAGGDDTDTPNASSADTPNASSADAPNASNASNADTPNASNASNADTPNASNADTLGLHRQEDGMLSPFLKWQVSTEKPVAVGGVGQANAAGVIEVKNQALAEALRYKCAFSRQEVMRFELQLHSPNCFVEVDQQYYTPVGPRHDHHIPDQDVCTLLEMLHPAHKRRREITTVLKTFGYHEQWRRWSAGADWGADRPSSDQLDAEWRDADDTSDMDLNYIVALVNRSHQKRLESAANRQQEAVRLSNIAKIAKIAKNAKIAKIERVYFTEPFLGTTNQTRITRRLNAQFLSPDLLQNSRRVSCIQSCTGSGKTHATIAYARERKLPVLSICAIRTQVTEHCRVFGDADHGLPARTVHYQNIPDDFKPGVDNCVTTLDSLLRIKERLHEHTQEYLLYIDEIHSVIDYVLHSQTLDCKRKDVLSALSWLFKNAQKVVMTDNHIDDRDIEFIDAIKRVPGRYRESTAFIVNDYQKYTGIKVLHVDDPEELMARMDAQTANSTPFTCACNTKKRAQRVAMRLRQDHPQASILCYTSEDGPADTTDMLPEWLHSSVIYSPRITTGVDHKSREPQECTSS